MVSEVENAPDIIARDLVSQKNGDRHGMPATYTCPDCGGVLWQLNECRVYHFFFHLGHSFAPDALLALQSEELENALWTALRSLREKSGLLAQMAKNARSGGRTELADRLDEQAEAGLNSLNLIRDKLLGGAESAMTQSQDPRPDGPAPSPAGTATPFENGPDQAPGNVTG